MGTMAGAWQMVWMLRRYYLQEFTEPEGACGKNEGLASLLAALSAAGLLLSEAAMKAIARES